MRPGKWPTRIPTRQVIGLAHQIGLYQLQQYVDHVTGTRWYGFVEETHQLIRPLGFPSWRTGLWRTDIKLRHPTWEPNREGLPRFSYREVWPARGEAMLEFQRSVDVPGQTRAVPFAVWYGRERRRLERDIRLLEQEAERLEAVAAQWLEEAQSAYVEAEADTGDPTSDPQQAAREVGTRRRASAHLIEVRYEGARFAAGKQRPWQPPPDSRPPPPKISRCSVPLWRPFCAGSTVPISLGSTRSPCCSCAGWKRKASPAPILDAADGSCRPAWLGARPSTAQTPAQ